MPDLSQLVDLYCSKNPDQVLLCHQIQDFLRAHEAPFHRESLLGHVTGSAFLLNGDASHFLLMHHTKLGIWAQPGGHCDGDRDVLAVALKEAQEESGIDALMPLSQDIFDVDIHDIPVRGDVPPHKHYDIRFLMKTQGNDALVQNGESLALRWFPLFADSWDVPLEPSVSRMISKAQAWVRRGRLG